MNEPLKFQECTANHVLELFKNGQKRVLVGDEAGLGKTTVAATVVESVKSDLAQTVLDDDGMYCIVYVCCNLQIAQQNINTLCNTTSKVDLSQSRLSMQHFVYHQQKTEGGTLVLSLTPGTSFKIEGGMGSAHERALIYNCLILHDEFKGRKGELSRILRGRVEDDKRWGQYKDDYAKKIADLKGYDAIIVEAMNRHISELLDAFDGKTDKETINKLRKTFAYISLEAMKPDLVIMDEFQKFSSLIDINDESDESFIARQLFSRGDGKDPYILLLSATPYKPYTTLDEINLEKCDEQFRDFHKLMDFLNMNDEARIGEFRQAWQEYSALLQHLDSYERDVIISRHKKVEDMLYGVMCRTERSNKGIVKEVKPELEAYLTSGDIASYVQMRQLVDKCKKHGVTAISAPVDYTKSCAFQLSFMDNYLLKKKIEDHWGEILAENPKVDRLLLDKEKVESYELLDCGNARLAYVADMIFGNGENGTGVENLLWVPASHPYYKQPENVFTTNEDFSKTLVFSSWGMVPRMLSCLISYECERRAGVAGYRKNYSGEFNEPLNVDGKSVLCKVSTWLADQYDTAEHYMKGVDEIRAEIVKAVAARIEEVAPDAPKALRVSSLDILQLLAALDDPQEGVRNVHEKSAEMLADMAIGSPAICLYRSLKAASDDERQSKQQAKRVAEGMMAIFNNAHGTAAVNNVSDKDTYYHRVIDYCIQGSLQAVLDEFVHMIRSNDAVTVADRILESFIGVTNIKVNTQQTFGDSTVDDQKAFNMRKHFAVDLATEKTTEKNAQHAIDVRMAFNSPFRPFVLSSTSVGQEGLDFHWYSRKMVHWNLPSNPQSLEQREGRISRYKCHSVRRNIARLYAGDPAAGYLGWQDMFAKAGTDLAVNNSGMIPMWYLPLDHPKFNGLEDRIEYIERIVPMYPLSEDVERYDKLIKVLSLYRLTMGQPRQEELVDMLAGVVSHDMIDEMIFNLSPYFRNKEQVRKNQQSEI